MQTTDPLVAENENLQQRVAAHPFLKGMEPHQIDVLTKSATPVTFGPGQVAFRAGEPANGFFLVETGAVVIEAEKGGRSPVAAAPVGAPPFGRNQRPVKDHVFTIGIEEEFQIIDPETRGLRSHIQQILDDGKIAPKPNDTCRNSTTAFTAMLIDVVFMVGRESNVRRSKFRLDDFPEPGSRGPPHRSFGKNPGTIAPPR